MSFPDLSESHHRYREILIRVKILLQWKKWAIQTVTVVLWWLKMNTEQQKLNVLPHVPENN
jgi:hypothetical protein